ncbi:MAG TPA: T9SS type A sorting domain-containing protein [Saprospiraceae bacterium]|nr:T9SS type A sorting domain-containing protein [Saprospiraceae bacterium]
MKQILLFLILLICSFPNAQSFFSVVPDFGGDKREGKIFNVIPLDNEIKFIGALHDSIVPGLEGGTWPIYGTFSYSGDLLNTQLLVDSLYLNGFSYVKRRIAFKNDSICYIYDRRDIGNPKLNSYLIEMNYQKGEILRSKIIYDTITSINGFLATDVCVGKDGQIYLINAYTVSGSNPEMLTVLDTNFNVVNQSIIPNFGRDNVTKFTEVNSDGSLVMVGVSLGDETQNWYESKLYRQVLDKDYKSVDFKLAQTNLDQTIIGFESYPLIKTSSGDWVFATQVVYDIDSCLYCWVGVPYIVSISSDFSKVNFETRLFDGDINSNRPEFFARSITEVSDGYIFLGSSDGTNSIQTSGLIGKTSLDGDSLWLKHIIPLQWDTTQALWFLMQDIKTTPQGNILIGGFASDGFNQIILPWLAQLDKDGCMEPGCNIVATSQPTGESHDMFSVFPNPASTFIGINCLKDLSENCNILIYDYSGKMLLRKSITPQQGNQYMINVPEEIQGAHILSIQSATGEVLYSKNIIIQ